MKRALVQAWDERFSVFYEKLSNYKGNDRYKAIIYNFEVFRERYKKLGDAMFTRENIKWLSDDWSDLIQIKGQATALQEFPDWPFIITQFQLFVLLSELQKVFP